MTRFISNIVFSKNRPLQLDAYLESFYRYFPSGLIRTYIIYQPELFKEEYKELFRKHSHCVIIRERDFHSDFLSILGEVDTKYVLFGVDDVVYFDTVDFGVVDECFDKFTDDIFGFSLRHSCQAITGGDNIEEFLVSGQTVYRYNWKSGQTFLTNYPFDLCSTIYPTTLVKNVIERAMNTNVLIRKLFSPCSFLIKAFGRVISTRSILKSFGYFFSPNTLESWNCRWCQDHSDKLPNYIYFQKLCASAIQINMVNTSTNSETNDSVEHTVEALNEKYKTGYRLDIDFVAHNKPTATHCGLEHFKLRQN